MSDEVKQFVNGEDGSEDDLANKLDAVYLGGKFLQSAEVFKIEGLEDVKTVEVVNEERVALGATILASLLVDGEI